MNSYSELTSPVKTIASDVDYKPRNFSSHNSIKISRTLMTLLHSSHSISRKTSVIKILSKSSETIENSIYLAKKEWINIVIVVLDTLGKSCYNNQTTQQVKIQLKNSCVLTEFKEKSKYELIYKVDENSGDAMEKQEKFKLACNRDVDLFAIVREKMIAWRDKVNEAVLKRLRERSSTIYKRSQEVNVTASRECANDSDPPRTLGLEILKTNDKNVEKMCEKPIFGEKNSVFDIVSSKK